MRKIALYTVVAAAVLVIIGISLPSTSVNAAQTRAPGVQIERPLPCPQCGTPFTIEVGCTIQLNAADCTQTATPSTSRRFVIETVSFSGQATHGQTVQANFVFNTGGKKAFVWLPVQNYGPGVSAGTDVSVATFAAPLVVDVNSSIQLSVGRNSMVNAGQNYPYSQRLNLMGHLE